MSYITYFPESRFFNFRIGIGIPVLIMGLLLIFDPTELDFLISKAFYVSGVGFIGQNNFWLENILHHRAKQVVIVFAILVAVSFFISIFFKRFHPLCRPLGYVLLAIILSTGIVTPLKILTAVHCPWSLSDFGGSESFSALLDTRAPSEKPGRCWPGGHASTGFSLIALFFFLRDRRPRSAYVALTIALLMGTVFSVGRIMQGAHFLSHNIWTLLINWIICLLCYRWLLYRAPNQRVDHQPCHSSA